MPGSLKGPCAFCRLCRLAFGECTSPLAASDDARRRRCRERSGL